MFRPRSTTSATIPATSGASMDRFLGSGGFGSRRGLRHRRHADLQRIGADRLGDVLELRRAEIGDGEIEPPLHLPIGVLGKTDRAGLGDAFQPRGDVDAVAHQIAVALLDDVAEMNADPEDDAAVLGHAGVALDHGVLNFDRAAHGVDDAAELDDRAVAGALDDAPVMHGDGRVDQVASQRSEPRQDAILVRAGKPGVADHVRAKNRREFACFGHRGLRRTQTSTNKTNAEPWRKGWRSRGWTGVSVIASEAKQPRGRATSAPRLLRRKGSSQ